MPSDVILADFSQCGMLGNPGGRHRLAELEFDRHSSVPKMVPAVFASSVNLVLHLAKEQKATWLSEARFVSKSVPCGSPYSTGWTVWRPNAIPFRLHKAEPSFARP